MDAETTAYRAAVEGNVELQVLSSLINTRLIKLINSAEEEEEREGMLAWYYIVLLQGLCKDFNHEHGEEAGRKNAVKFFWTKLLDFNGSRDLSDEQLRKLTNLGCLFEKNRVGCEDEVVKWIDEASDQYSCRPGATTTSRFNKLNQKWIEQKWNTFLQTCEDQLYQWSEGGTQAMTNDMMCPQSTGRADDIVGSFWDMDSTKNGNDDMDVCNTTDFDAIDRLYPIEKFITPGSASELDKTGIVCGVGVVDEPNVTGASSTVGQHNTFNENNTTNRDERMNGNSTAHADTAMHRDDVPDASENMTDKCNRDVVMDDSDTMEEFETEDEHDSRDESDDMPRGE